MPVDRKKFLDTIRQIESSGGKNTDHPAMNAGIQAGTQAFGQYGLMPNTVKEIAKRKLMQGEVNPNIQTLNRLPASQVNDYLSTNPDVEQQLADTLADRVLQRQGGDEEKAAFSWNMGHNLTPDQIQQRDYLNSPYVKKFDMIKNMVKPDKDEE